MVSTYLQAPLSTTTLYHRSKENFPYNTPSCSRSITESLDLTNAHGDQEMMKKLDANHRAARVVWIGAGHMGKIRAKAINANERFELRGF
jgi:hypothetical protein